ncbi:hypothetical protein OSB04_024027 [Centaurea solstitialis]|uniref:Reverse transcriptase Ty1/copia-type domain-containing protein n=1 Tax=Centaurea solstitialis TaxID=347529 RepID=A0AA38SKB5_9ASTR|nr:hypothetical protein OSB04_024027 [Centaurea solstitialis]
MWLYCHKFHANGTLARHKARLVINGKCQQVEVDCDETFSPVVKPTTICTVLILAISQSWPIHQLDVKNAFLHGDLLETVYMFQPLGFVDPGNPKHFAMSDLGPIHHFLGIQVHRKNGGLCLSQEQYMLDILNRAKMQDCKPSTTPVDTNSKLSTTIGNPLPDSSLYPEYKGVINAMVETTWLRNLLLELHLPLRQATIIYCDNISAVYLTKHPMQHQRTKHVEIDLHFVRKKVRLGALRLLHVPIDYQYANIFTKGLPRHLFTRFRSSLTIQPATDSTEGEY